MNTKRMWWLLATVVMLVALVPSAHAFYDPGTQRWITRDPIQERDGICLYRYVRNSPVNHRDALGLSVAFDSGDASVGAAARCLLNELCNAKVATKTLNDVKAKIGNDVGDVAKGGNAFMHCVAACRASQKCGADEAKKYWDGREGPGTNDREKYGDKDSDMDLANNGVGYGTTGDCWQGCKDAWKDGKLTCIDFHGNFVPCGSTYVPEGL